VRRAARPERAAFRILDALIDRPQCYFVGAGDKDQVIHAKLGASDEYLNRRFAERYPKLQRYPLTQTWRHGPHLAYAMAEFKQKQVESGLPLRTEIRQAHYSGAPNAPSAWWPPCANGRPTATISTAAPS
jgi:DNA helicase-2/ATP-dependent DNA helicase PcrA